MKCGSVGYRRVDDALTYKEQKFMRTMKDMKKVLTVVMALAVAFAGVVVLFGEDSDADGETLSKDKGDEGLYFDFASKNVGNNVGWSNYDLKNQIEVTSHEEGDVIVYTVTGILAKQSEPATEDESNVFWKMQHPDSKFYYGIAFDVVPEGGVETIQIGAMANGLDGTNCLLYVKKADTRDVEYSGKKYCIDYTGVTLAEEEDATDYGYVVIPNENALGSGFKNGSDKKGVGADGGTWSLNDETLTLTNYNGNEYFGGAFTEVILVGKNTITLSGVNNALNSTAGITIKSIDGVGSLDIVMKDVTAAEAIKSSAKVEINGVDVSITVNEKEVDESAESSEIRSAVAISADGFSIYDASLTIDVAETDYKAAEGIKVSTGSVDVKSSTIKVNAGFSGITGGSVTIAASVVDVKADQFGINVNNGNITITNKSDVKAEVFGLAEGYNQPYGIYTGGMGVQSDSVLRTCGMYVSRTVVNNATMINDGDMVIGNSGVFGNAGVFENNGVVGIYGAFTNSLDGKTVNNGTLSSYAQNVGSLVGKKLETKDDSGVLTIEVKGAQCLADGKFLIGMYVSYAGVSPTANGAGTEPNYVGTIDYEFEQSGEGLAVTGYTIDAVSVNDGTEILTVVYDKSLETKYDVYSSEFSYVSTELENVEGESADGLSKTGVIIPSNASISVSGGTFSNRGVMSVGSISEEFVNGGEISNEGTLNINSSIIVLKGELNGNDAVVGSGVTIILSGEVNMVFTHDGSYTEDKVVTKFTDIVEVVGKPVGVEITTPPESGLFGKLKGFMKVGGMDVEDSEATVTVLQGSAVVEGGSSASAPGNIGTKVVLKVASGATLQISGYVDAKAGVIAIQDGATLNMKASDRETFGFGTLVYTISFKNEGYTYYGSIQFALANAAEGDTLELDSDATIESDTVVKKGITLVFADKKKLIIGSDTKAMTFSMEEGAAFILGKESEIDVKKNVGFSGTVVYDSNEVVLSKIKFNDADATFEGVPATKSDVSSMNMNVNAIDGIVTVSKGLATGTIKVMSKENDEGKLDTTAKLNISEGATLKTASFADSEYAENIVDGKLQITANAFVEGKTSGAGSIILENGVSLTFKGTAIVDLTVSDGVNGFIFDEMKGKVQSTNPASAEKTFTLKAEPKTATKAASLVITGDVVEGVATAEGNVFFGDSTDNFTIGSKAIVIVPKDSTLTVSLSTNKSKADGLLKVAGEINMKVAGESGTNNYGELGYQITYEDGEYTVYTMLSTGVSNATAGDSFEVTKNMYVESNMEIPAGVTLIIGDGVKITVGTGKYISIGTPIKSVGATSSIQGVIVLEGTAFVIVYADDSVDLSKATIVNEDEEAAKNSQYSILNEVYAMVYVADSVVASGSEVEKVLVPEIDGYRFLGWKPLVGGDSAKIGVTDFEANMKASMVKVTFTKVDGISYYVDNEKQNLVGAPVYVAYGSTVTAVADYGYTGNALVNGQAYIIVDTDTTTITGSGVSVSEPEVTVDPAKDDSMGITEYLLIVLVILAAILVVVVAIRMMRS